MITRRRFIFLSGEALALLAASGCTKEENESKETNTSTIDVEFTLPSAMEVSPGGEMTFTVLNGKNPLLTDSFVLESSSTGVSYTCAIIETSSLSFTAELASNCKTTGSYYVYIRRGTDKKAFGSTYMTVAESIDGLVLDESTTAYGVVSDSNGIPLEGVVISDGVEVVATDKDGVYQLPSKKERGYLFMSIPSGYEVEQDGIRPLFYYLFNAKATDVERCDFTVTRKEGQDHFKMLVMGDMHLARMNNDINQFSDFTDDMAEYLAEHKGEVIYGLTLGDMTWDVYWYSALLSFPEYLDYMNSALKDFQVFHTMGNHDNDFKGTTDFSAEQPFINQVAPNYYSYNIGKIHFVVLDNIDCTNHNGTSSGNSYQELFTTQQLEWLKKDLEYVDKSTPLIISSHAQIFWPSGATAFSFNSASSRQANSQSFIDIVKDYTTHYVSGHSHDVFNVTPDDSIVNGQQFFEHNSGAVCAGWWRSGNDTPGIHVAKDGAPGGYVIWEIDGTNISYTFKGTNWPETFQCRTYDLNNVHFSMDDVPLMDGTNTTLVNAWMNYVNAYPNDDTYKNRVLINVWNWSSRWTIKVVGDDGKTYTATPVNVYDPLHILAMSMKEFNKSTISSTPVDITVSFCHFFRVTCDDADTNLTITVTDEAGNEYSEYMERPKEFNVDIYKPEKYR